MVKPFVAISRKRGGALLTTGDVSKGWAIRLANRCLEFMTSYGQFAAIII